MTTVRDHGYGDSPEVTGVPRASQPGEQASGLHDKGEGCPNCGCMELMQVEVGVKNERLKGGTGLGIYVGCPACPWASPMLSVANEQ